MNILFLFFRAPFSQPWRAGLKYHAPLALGPRAVYGCGFIASSATARAGSPARNIGAVAEIKAMRQMDPGGNPNPFRLHDRGRRPFSSGRGRYAQGAAVQVASVMGLGN